MPPRKSDPWMPALYDDGGHIIASVKAWAAGTASETQQQTAFRWVVEVLCGYYDLSFRPDDKGGPRATDFAEGKRFVGLQIVKMTKLVQTEKPAVRRRA